jgi:hypothetical protein
VIHAPKESRPTSGPTLNYMYRGDRHEHNLVGFNGQPSVIHIGGNIFSGDPLIHDENGQIVVDISDMESEFELGALNNRTAEKKFKHYIISIEKGAQLDTCQWLQIATEYIEALGFDFSHKWTACLHNDSEGECQHIHILASLVSTVLEQSLVSTSNDFSRGWPVMRKFEKQFGLKELVSPGSENDFGFNFTKGQMKSHGSRQACINNDWGAIIRARIKNLYETEGKPKTIKAFAIGLAKRNVGMQAVRNADGSIRGINYQVIGFKKNDKGVDSPFISGSKVKGTRFTWPMLLNKEKIDYKQERDDKFIGLAPVPQKLIASVKINKSQMRVIKMLGSKFKSQIRRNGYIDLSFCRTKHERNMALLVKAVMDLLKELFDGYEIEFYEYIIYENNEQIIEYDLVDDSIANNIRQAIQLDCWKDTTVYDKAHFSTYDLAA